MPLLLTCSKPVLQGWPTDPGGAVCDRGSRSRTARLRQRSTFGVAAFLTVG
jgi:hypothetical protein